MYIIVGPLTINDKPAVDRTPFNLSANDNRFTVTSTLFTPTGQVEPGPFSGFAFVIMSYMFSFLFYQYGRFVDSEK